MKNRPLLFFIVLHAVLFLGLFVVLSRLFYPGPGELERQVALKILSGEIPYRDFTSEYPPLALLSFVIPAVFFKTSLAYLLAFAGEMLVLDLIALVLIKSLAARFNISVREALGAYTLFVVAVGPIVVVRYDLVAAVLVLAALWIFIYGKRKTAWIFVALGVMAKIYPVVIAPILAAHYWQKKQIGELVKGGVVFAAVILLLSLPWMILDSSGFLYTIKYHAERGIQWESTYASVLLVGQILHLTRVTGEFNFGSWNIGNSPLADTLSTLSIYITIGLLLVVYIVYARRIWQKNGLAPEEQGKLLFGYSTLVILIFMLGNKVFSAQYLIWLCPLLPLVGGQYRGTLWLLFAVAAAITQYFFPYKYLELEMASPSLVVLLAGRNVLLGLMVFLLILPDRSLSALTASPSGWEKKKVGTETVRLSKHYRQ